MTSLLSDQKIKEEYKKGNIVITPFNAHQLKTSSYDVTLGNWYFRQQKQKSGFIHNPWDKQSVENLWGKPEQEKEKILLQPGELILGHTNEFIGGRNGITTMMKARSSMGRNGISVCKCAGWGDVGYTNRWTMEIQNGLDYPIILLIGEPIAQITFFRVGKILGSNYAKTGKYQNTTDQDELVKSWNPYMMIPQLWKDLEA